MKHSRLLANGLAAILCFLFVWVTSSDGQEFSLLEDHRPPYVTACWDDLDPEERAGLLQEFLALPRTDFLSESAEAYVQEEEDFMPTEIFGPIRLERNGSEQLVAFREGKAYAMDVPVGFTVYPGLYWTKGIGIAWTVILPDGDDPMIWVSREL